MKTKLVLIALLALRFGPAYAIPVVGDQFELILGDDGNGSGAFERSASGMFTLGAEQGLNFGIADFSFTVNTLIYSPSTVINLSSLFYDTSQNAISGQMEVVFPRFFAQLRFCPDSACAGGTAGPDYIHFGSLPTGGFVNMLSGPQTAINLTNGDNGDPPTQVPEPGTLALLAIGVLGLAISRRKRK